jgi:hypothetical protein
MLFRSSCRARRVDPNGLISMIPEDLVRPYQIFHDHEKPVRIGVFTMIAKGL